MLQLPFATLNRGVSRSLPRRKVKMQEMRAEHKTTIPNDAQRSGDCRRMIHYNLRLQIKNHGGQLAHDRVRSAV